MAPRIVENGKFRVYRNGHVERWDKKRGWIDTAICQTGRNRDYQVVNYTENGKQKRYYVHRLVGEAFVDNPDGKPQINHLDGDPSNNHASNLEWSTPKENIRHAYRIGSYKKITCTVCGNKKFIPDNSINPKTYACAACKQEKRFKEKREESAATKRYQLAERLSQAYPRNQRDRIMLHMRRQGKTLQEIGDEVGLTRERVRQILSKITKSKSVTRTKSGREAKTSNTPLYRLITANDSLSLSFVAGQISMSNSTLSNRLNRPELFRLPEIKALSTLLDISLYDLIEEILKQIKASAATEATAENS